LILTGLGKNDSGTILKIEKSDVEARLIEMGCYPGVKLKVMFKAAFKGPICIEINGSLLALRNEEAAKIVVQL